MSSIELTITQLTFVKKALHFDFPEIKSSHLVEAIAASLGRKTYAALRSELSSFAEDPPIESLNPDKFNRRIKELGYEPEPLYAFELSEIVGAIETYAPRCHEIEYRTSREKAWLNLITHTINEGIRRKIFSLRPGDNRWDTKVHQSVMFDFLLPNNLPVRAHIQDAGLDELAIHAAVNPKGVRVREWNAGFAAGDIFASSWLERQRGAWIQSTTESFSCRNAMLEEMSLLKAEPIGYGDRGHLIM
jgi:hypothetical protein